MALYIVLGVAESSLSLVSAVAGKYAIDIITGYHFSKLGTMAAVMVGATLSSLLLRSLISRVSTKISLYVSNDIQAMVFDAILDADWLELTAYSSGELTSRFNTDVTTVASNAISWLPNLVIGGYTFAATFLVIFHYDRVMALLALASRPVFAAQLQLSHQAHAGTQPEDERDRQRPHGLRGGGVFQPGYHQELRTDGRMRKRAATPQEAFKKANLDYNRFSIQTEAAISLLGSAVQMAAFGYCLYLLWSGQIVYGTMTLFLSQSAKLSTTFRSLVGVVPRLFDLCCFGPADPGADGAGAGAPAPRQAPTWAGADFPCVWRTCGFPMAASRWCVMRSFWPGPVRSWRWWGPPAEERPPCLRLMLGLVHPSEGRVYLRSDDGVETTAAWMCGR